MRLVVSSLNTLGEQTRNRGADAAKKLTGRRSNGQELSTEQMGMRFACLGLAGELSAEHVRNFEKDTDQRRS